MLPIKKICCPTDFSDPSYEALKAANEIALHFSAELILLHVVTPIPIIPIHDDPSSFNLPLYEKEMETNAARALKQIQAEKIPVAIQTQIVVVQGDPASRIVKLADNKKVDMIVIATHGFSGWKKMMFGSVTAKVIRLSTCPVLSIRIPQKKKNRQSQAISGG